MCRVHVRGTGSCPHPCQPAGRTGACPAAGGLCPKGLFRAGLSWARVSSPSLPRSISACESGESSVCHRALSPPPAPPRDPVARAPLSLPAAGVPRSRGLRSPPRGPCAGLMVPAVGAVSAAGSSRNLIPALTCFSWPRPVPRNSGAGRGPRRRRRLSSTVLRRQNVPCERLLPVVRRPPAGGSAAGHRPRWF